MVKTEMQRRKDEAYFARFDVQIMGESEFDGVTLRKVALSFVISFVVISVIQLLL